MYWGQKTSLLLLIIIHGVCCSDISDASCSTGSCSCGESVIITCNGMPNLWNITIIEQNSPNDTVFENDVFAKNYTKNYGHFSINYTEDKVMMTIFEVRISDIDKYWLYMTPVESNYIPKPMNITVSGICEPKVSKNNDTNELLCEAESKQENASIVWMDNKGTIYQGLETKKHSGYKLQSSLNLTEEEETKVICCVISHHKDGVYEENKTCTGNVLGKTSALTSDTPTRLAIGISLPIALVAAALVYWIKIRNRIICRVRCLSQALFRGQKVPGEESTTIPPLLPPQTV